MTTDKNRWKIEKYSEIFSLTRNIYSSSVRVQWEKKWSKSRSYVVNRTPLALLHFAALGFSLIFCYQKPPTHIKNWRLFGILSFSLKVMVGYSFSRHTQKKPTWMSILDDFPPCWIKQIHHFVRSTSLCALHAPLAACIGQYSKRHTISRLRATFRLLNSDTMQNVWAKSQ